MSRDLVAGVDIGSSGARAVAINPAGQVIAESVARYGNAHETSSGEADPNVWLAALSIALDGLDCDVPVALGVAGHSPTTVASTGALALTFRHSAGESSNPAAQQAAHAQVIRERLGSHVAPRRLWDHLLSQLGGDPNVQSVWMDMEPLQDFGDPIPVGTRVGTSDGSHGVPEGIALVPGAADAYMTLWASGVDMPGRAFDPGGRAGGLGVAATAVEHEELARYGMPSHVRGISVVGGPTASHGALMDWWSEVTGRSVAELLELARSIEPGARGVMALPYLEGARAPRWNRDLRARIDRLGVDSDAGVVARALLESTAYGLAHIARSLAEQGIVLDRVVCSGGPSRSDLWVSIKAAVLEVPIDVPACSQMAAYGAALAAGSAAEWWPMPGEGSPGDWPMPPVTTVHPKPSETYRRGLDRFIALGDQAIANAAKPNAEGRP